MSEYEINEPRRIGLVLREVRRARGLTQADLAQLSGVSRGWLVRFEQGHSSAEVESIFRVISALGLTMKIAEPQVSADEAAQEQAFDQLFGAGT